MKRMRSLALILGLLTLSLIARPMSANTYEISTDSLYKHLSILASDSLEGRETGEIGEMKAARYIAEQFASIGLIPMGDSGTYLQSFEFVKKIDPGPANSLAINGVALELDEEFKPMVQSANIQFEFDQVVPVGYGMTLDSAGYDDYAGLDVDGKAVLVKRFQPVGEDTTGKFDAHNSLADKVINAIDHGAAGVFFFTPSDEDDTMMTRGFTHVTPKDIPIVYLRRKGLESLGIDIDNPVSFSVIGETELIRVRDTAYNVVGYIDSGNDTSMVIGAHFDHIGWGGASSRYRGEEKKIHYGADDNASGTAAMIELARRFSSEKDKLRHSLVFVAFTGEEKGILGSSHYARNMTVDENAVKMMVNMDMIGRLKDQEKGLAIMGTGTCPEFKEYFDSLPDLGVTLAQRESGMGPSDHSAFYNREIPVLFFFTGAHDDYHKPEDVVEKIDFDGIVKIAGIVHDAVEHFDSFEGPLEFQKTKTEQEGKTRRQFSVTLGIMPDFITEVTGLRVDGVSADQPAERAGVQTGDIIIRMGNHQVDDIYTYMNCLDKFRKGDTTRVTVIREADTLDLEVIFE